MPVLEQVGEALWIVDGFAYPTRIGGWRGWLMRADALVGDDGSTPREWRATAAAPSRTAKRCSGTNLAQRVATLKTPASFRVTLSQRPFGHVFAIAALVGCGGMVATSPDASTGCPSADAIRTQSAVGEPCSTEGMYCAEPDCDPCSQNCHAVACTTGGWATAIDTGICADAAACVTIDVSTFDTSCNVDSDCMPIAPGTYCSGQPWCQCGTAAVNVDGQSQYAADQQAMQALGPQPMGCGCPYFGSPRCIAHVCTICGGPNACPDGG